jgi:hypothetical protein
MLHYSIKIYPLANPTSGGELTNVRRRPQWPKPAIAKTEAFHMSRPPALNHDQRWEAFARRDAGEALTDIARTFGVNHTTIGRLGHGPALD